MQKVAIFDIDGTIFRSSLYIQIVLRLIEEGIFKKTAAQDFARQKLAWLDRKGDYDVYVKAVVGAFTKNIKGGADDEIGGHLQKNRRAGFRAAEAGVA